MAGVEREDDANLVERLVPLAARALADETQALRDRGEDPALAVVRLHDLRSSYPAVVAERQVWPDAPGSGPGDASVV
jgi:hypothetical protein